MPYTDHFRNSDDVFTHLITVVPTIPDAFIQSRYAGFAAISAVTVYELAIKEIFIQFARAKSTSFGNFAEKVFSRINGRIMLDSLTGEHIRRFGEKYEKRFKKRLNALEGVNLAAHGTSIKSQYGSLITCRHDFVHEMTIQMTFTEVATAYETGKQVIHCLHTCMNR